MYDIVQEGYIINHSDSETLCLQNGDGLHYPAFSKPASIRNVTGKRERRMEGKCTFRSLCFFRDRTKLSSDKRNLSCIDDKLFIISAHVTQLTRKEMKAFTKIKLLLSIYGYIRIGQQHLGSHDLHYNARSLLN